MFFNTYKNELPTQHLLHIYTTFVQFFQYYINIYNANVCVDFFALFFKKGIDIIKYILLLWCQY